jgi:hypothetical protein
LDGGGRVEKRRVGKRTLGDVHEHAQPVGDVLIEGALEAERDASQHRILVELSWLAVHPEQRCTCRNELADRRHWLQHAPSVMSDPDEIVIRDLGDYTGRVLRR